MLHKFTHGARMQGRRPFQGRVYLRIRSRRLFVEPTTANQSLRPQSEIAETTPESTTAKAIETPGISSQRGNSRLPTASFSLATTNATDKLTATALYESNNSASSVNWGMIAGISVGGLLSLLLLLLMFILFIRSRNQKVDSQNEFQGEEKPNALYEMEATSASANDVIRSHDQDNPYAIIPTGSNPANEADRPEHLPGDVYSLAVETGQSEASLGAMTENVLYGSR